MPTAEIIAIGTELLLGEIQDTNTRELAIFLRNNGIDLYRATIVGDNTVRIASAIMDAFHRVDIIITSGGLGPTVDDPTRDAVALAVEKDTEFIPELWNQIQDRFKRFGRIATENNKRQAFIPAGAIPVENKVGTAPAFIVEYGEKVIISLPGVPRELEFLLREKIQPYLKSKFQDISVIKAKILHAAGIGESQVDTLVGDLETNKNPTVGLLAHPGQVDIRVTAKAKDLVEADNLIETVISEIKNRLGDNIYGEDQDTLESVILSKLEQNRWTLTIYCKGLDEGFNNRLKNKKFNVQYLYENDHLPYIEITEKSQQDTENPIFYEVVYTIQLTEGLDVQKLDLALQTAKIRRNMTITYGGPPLLRHDWAANQALDFLRRNL
jgi:nicotinamide-nucleotide amidase